MAAAKKSSKRAKRVVKRGKASSKRASAAKKPAKRKPAAKSKRKGAKASAKSSKRTAKSKAPKAKRSSAKKSTAKKPVRRKKIATSYDGKLIVLAERLAKKGGSLSINDANALLKKLQASNDYSLPQKSAIRKIRADIRWSASADRHFRTEIRRWAAQRGHRKAA